MDKPTAALAARDSDAFAFISPKELRLTDVARRRQLIVMPLFILSFLLYLGTLVVLSYGPALVAQQVSGSINVAYVLALLQFVSTFIVAIAYALLAKRWVDPVTNKISLDLISGAGR